MEILLHENIKRRRKERGLTQEQLSEAMLVKDTGTEQFFYDK